MPPKKKKTILNPVVVGTVSTRSTRRQSVVNIEIPKSSKSSVKNTFRNPGDGMAKGNNEFSEAENLSEKIKQTYNKMINRTLEPITQKSVIVATDLKSSITKAGESQKQSISKVKSKVRSNEALLQILEDWTDDESQDDKKEFSDIDERDITENVQEYIKNDPDKRTILDLTIMIHNQSVNEASTSVSVSNQHEMPTETQECIQKDFEVKMDVEDIIKMETATINENQEIETYVVEKHEPLCIEEHVEEVVEFDEENIVECVTEEVIAENDQFVLMDSTPTEFEIPQQESPASEEIPKCGAVVDTTIPSVEKMVENKGNITEHFIVEEISQSVSTTDSNDAEVRSFFVKEIESNRTVKEADIPTSKYDLEQQASSSRENAGSVGSLFEENIESEALVKSGMNAVTLKENPVESTNNSDSFEEKDTSNNISLSENLVPQKCDNAKFKEQVVFEDTDFKKEIVEPMDIVEETNEDTIESKVAQMHLVDEVVKDDDTSEELSEMFNKSKIDLNYPLKEDIEEVIGVKASREYLKEQMKLDDELYAKKLSIDLNMMAERPKTRRTRSIETKTIQKIEEQLDTKSTKNSKSKEKKHAKVKDNKAKEPKSVKELKNKKKPVPPQPTKKIKERTERKDMGKTDKKDTVKKATKNENELLKKSSKSDNTDSEDTEVRRSSRIKSISVLKKKTTGHGLVRSKSEPLLNESDVSDSNSTHTESEKSTPSASPKVLLRDKKSRWTKSSENLSLDSQSTDSVIKGDNQLFEVTRMDVDEKPKLPVRDPIVTARLKQFVHLKENSYKTDRMTCKEAKKMTCDCFLTAEEIEAKEYGCGEDCLNRLLLIECGNLCQVADRCTNKRFQKGQFAPVEVFNADKKGLGLRAAANIPYGEFILEYVGEVLNCDEFDKRAEVYSEDKNIHYYFMSLRADAIIDATMKGNISRFINHSCDPNAETQKWTVNGELRIGFFSTRTILAGEEITFDYRFQRYGKEAQKCYCEAAICRGWLGEQPDEDSEDEDEEEEEEEYEEEMEQSVAVVKKEVSTPQAQEIDKVQIETKVEVPEEGTVVDVKVEGTETEPPTVATITKRKSPRKKPRKDLFEELDQLDEEIDLLVTTGLKNQAHTLKLSRLMVRAKEPPQRTKLLRILRRGELPCRRLFLDYHGLRLMHGYMIDAQHLVHNDKKFESLRLEMLQTLAVLPIPNKTMLQDSKVLPTVEKWTTDKDLGSPLDSDSNSPKNEQQDTPQPPPTDVTNNEKNKESTKISAEPKKEDEKVDKTIEDQEEEIRFLASKLLEGWANLKEVFRIPKKERIEQMKEHEREANKKFMQGGYGNEPDSNRKSDRYRHLSRYKTEREFFRKGSKSEEKPSAEFIRLSKIERRKLFALQHELKEEERRLKQREMWRQHELNCMIIGTDPRFTAPFDPSRGYQCIWNPQIGQWQNYPLPAQNQMIFSPQTPTANMGNLNMPPPQIQVPKAVANFPYSQQIPIAASLNGGVGQLSTSMSMTGQVQPPQPVNIPPMHMQQQVPNLAATVSQMSSMQGIPGALPQNIPTHPQMPTSMSVQPPLPQYEDPIKEEDPSQVKFMGPIPPPAKLPPKWKCAKDKYGRPYYYHIKIRLSQWEPPPFVEPSEELLDSSESETSSDTSSISSDTSTENSDSDDDIDDARLLMEVRKQMEKSAKLTLKSVIPEHVKMEDTPTPSPDDKISDEEMENDEDVAPSFLDEESERPSIDIRLKEQFNLMKEDNPPKKKRRMGLCEEIMISPRTEEDKLQFKEDLKRYKANKEKLKRQKEFILQQTRKQLRETDSKKARDKRARAALKSRIKEMPDFNSEQAKKIKENFRANMASTVVGSLNAYRKPDCKEGRITNTEDFKHLARKLTHFVMLKEMKHIEKIEDLTCTDNVKSKAREYIRKYMSKFGEMYVKRNDSPDFKD